ncbi:MAG: uncharacterized protein A8A55_1227 [Amphiamblys sp. WSBS2006]|nr:MAG: uncharacterized protein A8A55_1227 [Amphiamblys sp. WSBS2006]
MRQHPCPLCQRAYKRKGHLAVHLLTHKRARFVCPRAGCGSEFRYPHGLERHMKTHTVFYDVAPRKRQLWYRMDRQAKRTKTEKAKKVEKTETASICNLCGRVFPFSVFLLHKRECGYVCPFSMCLYRAKSKATLKTHIHAHHRGLLYCCPFCALQSRYKMCIRRHMRTAHPENFSDFVCPRLLEQSSADQSGSQATAVTKSSRGVLRPVSIPVRGSVPGNA